MSSGPKAVLPRKVPVQTRSKRTVAYILEGAARVFRSEGFGATTNRIAEAAGVGIATLYEYFPNKAALLHALAEQHVHDAESGVALALAESESTASLLAALQAAITNSQRYPSQAIDLLAEPTPLRARVAELRHRIMTALIERATAAGAIEPELRARTAFGLIGELSSRSLYELDGEAQRAFARHLLTLACQQFQ
jgi:AcrR family transcriptional regulator